MTSDFRCSGRPARMLCSSTATAVLYLERGGRSLLQLPARPTIRSGAIARLPPLPTLVAPGGPMRELRIERVDREPVAAV